MLQNLAVIVGEAVLGNVGMLEVGAGNENAALLEAGPLPRERIDQIRARWRAVADPTWVGQI